MHDYQSNLDSSVPLDLGPDGPGPLYERLARALREAMRCSRLPRRQLAAAEPHPGGRPRVLALGGNRGVRAARHGELRTGEDRLGYPCPRARHHACPAPGPAACQRTGDRADRHGAWPAGPAGIPGRPLGGRGPLDRRYSVHSRPRIPDPAGHQALREALAEYLTRAKGAQADPRRTGCQAVAVEDPGWHRAREVAGT